MGRLTLNVLLSFAQFEREVTAERVRDKIAASKAKGVDGRPGADRLSRACAQPAAGAGGGQPGAADFERYLALVAGRLAPQVGAWTLQTANGGRGVLLGGVAAGPMFYGPLSGHGAQEHNRRAPRAW